jgi:hypothetical protein
MSAEQPFHKAESEKALQSTTLPEVETAEEGIPKAVVPWNRDDDRSRYLGLRASGFAIRETLNLIGKAKSTLSAWRQDPTFLDLENRLPELRRELALEYASLEFLRNYRLILEKDYRVVKESLREHTKPDKDGNPVNVGMEAQDFKYLLQMRSHYTPQQLQAIENVFGKGGQAGEVNFTDFVLSLSRTKEEVKIETRTRQEPQLATVKIEEE